MLSAFKPDLAVADVSQIKLNWLQDKNIKLVCFDLDSTLIDHFEDQPQQKIVNYLKELKNNGFSLAIASNARSKQRQQRLINIAKQLDVSQKLVVYPGKQHTIKAKPSATMLTYIAKYSELQPEQICHVGDQLFKDVISANRAGCYAVLVAPLGKQDNRWVKYLQRPLEALIRPLLGLPLRFKDF